MPVAAVPPPAVPTLARRARSLWDGWVPDPLAVKVPQITLAFWVIKVLTTGTGEAASDFLAGRSLVAAAGLGLVGLVGLVVGLVLQLRSKRYQPWAYWLAVSMWPCSAPWLRTPSMSSSASPTR